jgi:hypothetical protein
VTDGDTSGNHRDIPRVVLDAIHAGDDRGFGDPLGERAARQAVLVEAWMAAAAITHPNIDQLKRTQRVE